MLSSLSPASSSGLKNTDPAGLLLSKAGYAERAAERGPHRPHGGRALSAALASPPWPHCAPAESPAVRLPEGLLSSPLLSFRPESPSQFPGGWVGGLFLHASSLSLLSWALGGPSVLRARFKAHCGQFQSALHTVLPGHCACPVPCVRVVLMPFLVITLGLASAPEKPGPLPRGEPALFLLIFHGTCVTRVQSVRVLVIPNMV